MASHIEKDSFDIGGNIVKEARELLKKKQKTFQLAEEQIDEDFNTYSITIDVKIKKNGLPAPATKEVLNWCGNILTSKP